MKQRDIQKKARETMPVNSKAKDTFFKTVYASEERQKKLAFLCDDIFYAMVENQATVSPNIPYRLLEYITAGLRSTVDSEPLLYGKKRVCFPIPKLYLLQTGLEMHGEKLPETDKEVCDMTMAQFSRLLNIGMLL